jgi:hypothetical protein
MVTGLDPETTYYFAIRSVDENSNWAWISNCPLNSTLKDPDLITPGKITDLMAIGPSQTSINLTWTAVGDDGYAGTASFYDIRYSTSPITGKTWSIATQCINEPTPQSSGKIEYFQVVGLEPDTKYYFAIRVGDETPQWSPLSNRAWNITLVKPDLTPPGKITDLTVKFTNSTSVTLSWTAPGDDGYSGTVAGYDIRYFIYPITEAIWNITNQVNGFPEPVMAGNNQNFTITGLIANQQYYFALIAYDDWPNYSPLSNIANSTTETSDDVTPPSEISNLTAFTISVNAIRLTWTAVGDDGSLWTATGYDIRYSTIPITAENWASANQCFNEPIPQKPGTNEMYIVTGLFSGTKYYFAIKTHDECPNYSNLSNVVNATTYASLDDITPAQIDDLAVLETTESSVTLTWTATGDDGESGNATAYELRYGKKRITAENWQTMQIVQGLPVPKSPGECEIFLIFNLEPGTTYYFAIRIADEVPNWSPISNDTKGTTLKIIRPLLSVKVTPEKQVMDSNETIKIEVEVFDQITKQPLEYAEVKVFSNYSDLEILPLNGLTGLDGKLIVKIISPIVINFTEIILYIEVTKVNYVTNLTQLKISIKPHPEPKPPEKMFNLHINDEAITFSKKKVYENDEIEIYALVTNTGMFESSAFRVKIYLNNRLLIGNYNFSGLAEDDFILIELPWVPKDGNYEIKIEIIAQKPHLELDDSDNIAVKTINVLEIPIDKDTDKKDDNDNIDKNDTINNTDKPDIIDNGTGDGTGQDGQNGQDGQKDQDKTKDTEDLDDGDETEDPIQIGGFLLIDLALIILIVILIIVTTHLIFTAKKRSVETEPKYALSDILLEISEIDQNQEPIEVEPLIIEPMEYLSDNGFLNGTLDEEMINLEIDNEILEYNKEYKPQEPVEVEPIDGMLDNKNSQSP